MDLAHPALADVAGLWTSRNAQRDGDAVVVLEQTLQLWGDGKYQWSSRTWTEEDNNNHHEDDGGGGGSSSATNQVQETGAGEWAWDEAGACVVLTGQARREAKFTSVQGNAEGAGGGASKPKGMVHEWEQRQTIAWSSLLTNFVRVRNRSESGARHKILDDHFAAPHSPRTPALRFGEAEGKAPAVVGRAPAVVGGWEIRLDRRCCLFRHPAMGLSVIVLPGLARKGILYVLHGRRLHAHLPQGVLTIPPSTSWRKALCALATHNPPPFARASSLPLFFVGKPRCAFACEATSTAVTVKHFSWGLDGGLYLASNGYLFVGLRSALVATQHGVVSESREQALEMVADVPSQLPTSFVAHAADGSDLGRKGARISAGVAVSRVLK